MAIPVVEFSRERYKIRKVFDKKSTYPKEIIDFENWYPVGIVASCQKLGIILENKGI